MTRLFELPPADEPAAPADPRPRPRAGPRRRNEDDRAAPSGPLVRVVLLLAYDGSGFHGFARQPGARTVGGSLAEALQRMSGAEVEIVCAGRTDTGVHATGQIVHADVPASLLRRRARGGAGLVNAGQGVGWLAQALTSQLGPEIAVRGVALAPEGFHARHSALRRRYRYLVLNTPAPDPLLARTSWHVAASLDLAVMRLACDAILGEHDFTAFCRRWPGGDAGEPIRRRVLSAVWSAVDEPAGLLRFDIEANAFCHQMVRALVGAHVAAGEGRLTAAGVAALLRSGSRVGAPTLAPAGGLCLTEVGYPPELAPAF